MHRQTAYGAEAASVFGEHDPKEVLKLMQEYGISARLTFSNSLLTNSSAGQLSRRVPLSRSCRPCVPVSGLGWGHHLLMVFRRRWTVYGAAADGKGNRGDPAPLSVVSSAEKERLQEAPFRALWGRSIFRTRIKGGGRKCPPPSHKAPSVRDISGFRGRCTFFATVGSSRWSSV